MGSDQQLPADPFSPAHANMLQILHTVRAYRQAGGGLIESAVIVAAFCAVAAAGGENGEAQ